MSRDLPRNGSTWTNIYGTSLVNKNLVPQMGTYNANCSFDSVKYRSAGSSLKVIRTSGVAELKGLSTIPPNTPYQLSGWYYDTSDNTNTPLVTIFACPLSNNSIFIQNYSQITLIGDNSWHQWNFTGTVPSGVYDYSFQIQCNDGGAPGDNYYNFDDFVFRPVYPSSIVRQTPFYLGTFRPDCALDPSIWGTGQCLPTEWASNVLENCSRTKGLTGSTYIDTISYNASATVFVPLPTGYFQNIPIVRLRSTFTQSDFNNAFPGGVSGADAIGGAGNTWDAMSYMKKGYRIRGISGTGFYIIWDASYLQYDTQFKSGQYTYWDKIISKTLFPPSKSFVYWTAIGV
jgi:hypothetical protein